MRPFTDILRDIRRGRVVDAASEQLATIVRGVIATGKPGELTLKLSIKPQGKGDNAVVITTKLTGKEPRDDLPEAIFFADEAGDLLREDPTQTRMFAEADDGEPTRRRRGDA